jgi:dTDP-4-amino-4,6-dideoxygalactose transaminase
MSELALLGGEKAVTKDAEDIFKKVPDDVMEKMDEAVLDVLHKWKMSGKDVTKDFEEGFANWHNTEYGLTYTNGTSAIMASLFGLGVGQGDEVICPSITYWASSVQIYSLGATPVFADIDPETLCIDPEDIEKKITEDTKAIVVVHYAGLPADMDAIMELAEEHDIKVLEDASHAHAALYKGKMVGTIGDVGAFSLMAGKSFGVGEAGILITDDREVYERALIFGHYSRHKELTIDYLKEGAHLPWGGVKGRVNQINSAIGLIMLDFFPKQVEEVSKAMNYFWDLLEDVPGVKAHRSERRDTTKGAWYFPLGLYNREELGGLSVKRFTEAVQAEGCDIGIGINKALHPHPLFKTIDIYNQGQPTRIANAERDVRELDGDLPVTEKIQERVFRTPLFYRFKPELIEEYANAVKKVANNYKELLEDDPGNPESLGMFFRY